MQLKNVFVSGNFLQIMLDLIWKSKSQEIFTGDKQPLFDNIQYQIRQAQIAMGYGISKPIKY